MGILALDPTNIYRITASEALYGQFPFLSPIKELALGIHKREKETKCTACVKRALVRAQNSLAAAFVKLLVDESIKAPNCLQELKVEIAKIMDMTIEQVMVSYLKREAGKQDLVF